MASGGMPASMTPVADPVVAKASGRPSVEMEIDAIRELLRVNIAAVRELVNERHERYFERFTAQDKAVAKAEEAQQAYNERSNEFRAALDDQGKTMITRSEADQRFDQMHELIDSQAKLISALQLTISRGEGKQAVADPVMTDLVQEMRAVRISQAAGAGKSQGSHAMWGYVVAAVSFIGMLITIGLALLRFSPK